MPVSTPLYTSAKPLFGPLQLDIYNPQAQRLRRFLPLNENGGTTLYDLGPYRQPVTTSASVPSWVSSKLGPALNFTAASSQYVQVGAETVNISLVTMLMWVKWSGNQNGTEQFCGFSDGPTSGTRDKNIGFFNSYNFEWHAYDGSSHYASDPAAADTNWHCLVGTADGVNAILYKDGVQVASVAAGNTYTGFSQADVFIGGNPGLGAYADFQCAAFGLWDRALAPAEVAAISAQTYAMLLPWPLRRWNVAGGVAPTADQSHLLLLGVT